MTTTISVAIAPPSATAVDQRPTNVAIHVPDLLFSSQADINRTLDLLQANGIDTVRVMIPWAAVEPLPGCVRLERRGSRGQQRVGPRDQGARRAQLDAAVGGGREHAAAGRDAQ